MLPGDRGPLPAGRSDDDLLARVHRRAHAIRFRRRMGVASALFAAVVLVTLVPVLAGDSEPPPDDAASGPAGEYGPADLHPGTPGSDVTQPRGPGLPVVTPTPACRSQEDRPTGEDTVRLPDVVGATEADARADLEAAGVQVRVERIRSERTAAVVVDQDPDAGYLKRNGCWVIITVSAGRDARVGQGGPASHS